MKWVIQIIILLIPLFLSTACSAPQDSKNENPNITIVKGKVQFPPGNTIDLYAYPEPLQKYLGKKTIVASSSVGKKGQFSFSVRFHQPTAFDLKIENTILVSNLFLCPGDEIVLDFSDSVFNPHIISNSKGGRDNGFLLQFNEIFFKEPKAKRQYYINSNFLHVDEYAEYLQTRRKDEIKLYNDFFSKTPARREFATYALSEINYQYATDKLMYLWKKGIKNKPVNPDMEYNDFSSKNFIENPEAVNSPSYVRFLNLYFLYLCEKKLRDKNIAGKDISEIDYAFEKIKFAKEIFSGLSLKIIQLNILNEPVNGVSGPNG